MSVTDLTNTTWLLNNDIAENNPTFNPSTAPYQNIHTANISFISNGNSYTYLKHVHDYDQDEKTLYYDNTTACFTLYPYEDFYWGSDNYKTIEITGGTDATNTDLISWLESNATQQVEPTPTPSSTGKIGDLPIIKKHFGDLEVIKEVLNGVTIYEKNVSPTPTPITYPNKSDIISLDLDGNGNENYLVLKNVSGTTYELIWMPKNASDYFYYAEFSSSGNTYTNGGIDTYLNSTWYNTLTQTAKSAIVDKTITLYKLNTNSFSGTTLGTITRHAYEISTSDITEYLGSGNVNATNVHNMLWKGIATQTTENILWLRDSSAHASNQASVLIYDYNSQSSYYSTNYGANTSHFIRPMLQIDLSKITFNINS